MKCKGCIFLGTYQDMGWSCDICELQDELANAIKACKCSADCLCKLTIEEAKELTKENEKLKDDKYYWKKRAESRELEHDKAVKKGYAYAKADTVRKMQERLKEKILHSVPTVYNSHFGRLIDQIAKELLEGTK